MNVGIFLPHPHKKFLDIFSQNLYNYTLYRRNVAMKNDYVIKMHDLIEQMGETEIIFEWIAFATRDELKEFVEHCEQHYGVETEWL